MTDYSNEQWGTAPSAEPAALEPLAPVLVAIAPSARQRRVTVLLRGILAMPHFMVLVALGAVGCPVLIIGWFGALFTGRLPDFAAEYLAGLLGWQTRVGAYSMLLTDKYPPFELGDSDYPVRVAVRPGKLDNFEVLFRCFLLIPVTLLVGFLSYGAFTIMGFITWLIVLIAGRMPDTLYEALSAVLRYSIRVYGYEYMLTSAYPGGLFGDQPPATIGQPTTTEWPTATEQPAFGETATAQPGPFATPNSWLLTLSTGAKRLVVFYIALGVIVLAGVVAAEIAVASSGINKVVNEQAATTIQSDFGTVNSALDSYTSKVESCNQQLSCLGALDKSIGGDLAGVATQLQSVPVSGSKATTALNTLVSDTTATANDFNAEGATTSASTYNSGLVKLQKSLIALSGAYNNMGTALNATS
jgi:Domain of unknown function (DUF4389)